MKGDANEDGKVSISDSIAISAYISNGSKNPLSAQGLENSDVHQTGNGINASDALKLQQFVTGSVSEL